MQRSLVFACLALAIASGCSSATSVPDSSEPPAVEEPTAAAEEPSPEPVEPTEAAPAEPEGTITREMLGDEWPLTVDAGVVACDGSGGTGAVTFTAEGTTYAVNGLAKGREMGADIETIWAADPSIPGAKKNIGPVIDRGLELCR